MDEIEEWTSGRSGSSSSQKPKTRARANPTKEKEISKLSSESGSATQRKPRKSTRTTKTEKSTKKSKREVPAPKSAKDIRSESSFPARDDEGFVLLPIDELDSVVPGSVFKYVIRRYPETITKAELQSKGIDTWCVKKIYEDGNRYYKSYNIKAANIIAVYRSPNAKEINIMLMKLMLFIDKKFGKEWRDFSEMMDERMDEVLDEYESKYKK